MAKDKLNKAVGNSFEDLDDAEMKKTQGAGDTDAETVPASPLSIGLIMDLTQKLFG